MINLLTCGAVAFGYTSDFDCGEYDFPSSELCSMIDMNYQNFRGGHPPLPDVILSNTPPPSPLRRAHSYHFLFPEKSEEQIRPSREAFKRSISTLPTPPPTPTSPQQGEAFEGPRGGDIQVRREEDDPDVYSARTRLGHIQEIRRRLGGTPAHFQPHQSLPQLTWEVPSIQRSRRMPSPPGEVDGAAQGAEGGALPEASAASGDARLRQIGADLRRIADQFQLDHGKDGAGKGNNNAGRGAWMMPAAFTRCLSASLLCILWWRLFNKLR